MAMSSYMRRAAAVALVLVAMTATTAVLATTPIGEWELLDASPDVRDLHFRIDVDTGSEYPEGVASPSINWAQYFAFEHSTQPSRFDFARSDNKKVVYAQIKGGIAAKGGDIPVVGCSLEGCVRIEGDYEWHVGHRYRLRIEISPRTPSDAEGNWWMFTLTDLDTHTKAMLGELKTPKAFGRMTKGNEAFLSYVSGGTCDTLRHSKVTMSGIKGKYGSDKFLGKVTNYTYGDAHVCAAQYILPGMHPDEYGSLSLRGKDHALVFIGNTYRGVHAYGQFQKTAKAGMMFAKEPDFVYPFIYRAVHDGEYTLPFPPEGQDNADWVSVGKGYPIINDLYHRQQRLHTWEQRNEKDVREGDFFVRGEPLWGEDLEYFRLEKKESDMMPIPTDKSDNRNWKYIGRHPYLLEDFTPRLEVQLWSYDRVGRKGALYHSDQFDGEAYYILRTTDYGYYPDRSKGELDNTWWRYVGKKP